MPRPTRSSKRHAELVELLNARRTLASGVRSHLSHARDAEREKPIERSGEHVQTHDDVGLAVAQLQAEMLAGVDAALKRLAEGRYGDCADCGEPIPVERLRALPFAVRCRDCEAAREDETARRRPTAAPSRLFGPDANY